MASNSPLPRRLIAFDLDGTVFQDGRPMTARTSAALEAAHQMGCLLVVSTGRGRVILPRELLAKPFLDYLSTTNGARVLDAKTGEAVLFRPMPAQLVLDLMAECPAAWQIFPEDDLFFERRSISFHLGRRLGNISLVEMLGALRSVRLVRSARRELARLGMPPVEKCEAVFRSEAARQAALTRLLARGDVEAVTTTGLDIEITAKGTSKGSALTALGEMLHIPRERILCFGDSGNDLSMAQAGYFVAMGNADAAVKAAADAITATVAEDGVALYLETWLKEPE